MRTITFALVGTGGVAPTHAEALRSMEGASLLAVYSRNAVTAASFAKKHSCTPYTDYNEMLKRPDLDAVIICTPSGLHADLGILAARAGKHVIVEKPIDVSLEKAEALIAACRKNKVKLCVIFQRRFEESVFRLKTMLAEGKLGRLSFGGCHIKLYRSQEYYDSGAWRGTWALDGGGVLINQGIHYIDLMQYLMGPVAEVSAYSGTYTHQRIEVEDEIVAALRFENGALGVIEATTNAYPGLMSRIDIYGAEGTAVIENDKLSVLKLRSGEDYSAVQGTDNAGVSSPAIDFVCHQRQLTQMVEAIREDKEPLVNGQEGRKALEIILAVYKSAYTGQRVKLPLEDSLFLRDLTSNGIS